MTEFQEIVFSIYFTCATMNLMGALVSISAVLDRDGESKAKHAAKALVLAPVWPLNIYRLARWAWSKDDDDED